MKVLTVKINGKSIFYFPSRFELLKYINDKKNILIAINAEKILNGDDRLKKIINNNIGYADGIGAVLALRRKRLNSIKIPGSELWLDIIKKFQYNKKFYLIGSTDEIIKLTVEKLKNYSPNINIINFRNGYFGSDDEIARLKRDIFEKKPDIIFVAMGTPAQEYLMEELIKIHPALYMGLGGSFDIYCGRKKRAPIIFQKLGLEWLYRLMKEPTRIGRQIVLLKFMYMLIRGKL